MAKKEKLSILRRAKLGAVVDHLNAHGIPLLYSQVVQAYRRGSDLDLYKAYQRRVGIDKASSPETFNLALGEAREAGRCVKFAA